jgi:hypothetical protein
MCDCASLREAGNFASWDDFDAFVAIVKRTEGLTQVPVQIPYSNVGLVETWYRCNTCQNIWRLVEPDPPFKGLWERVSL